MNSEPPKQPVEYARERVAVRDLIAWFIGSTIGAYLGFQAGLYIESSLFLLVSGIIGWIAGGIGGPLLLSLFIRSASQRTVSVRAASITVLGSIIGSFVGGFTGRASGFSEIVGALIGSIIGVIAGWLIGTTSADETLNKGETSKD